MQEIRYDVNKPYLSYLNSQKNTEIQLLAINVSIEAHYSLSKFESSCAITKCHSAQPLFDIFLNFKKCSRNHADKLCTVAIVKKPEIA